MKKHLFAFLIMLLLIGGLHAQNRIQSGFKPAKAFSGKINTNSRTSQIHAIVTTTTSTCMSVNLPAPATWSLANYGTGTPFAANGFVNGVNTYGDKEKAMYFDVSSSANTMITQVYVGFGIAYSATPTKTVAIKIYDGTSGTPAAALATRTIAMSTIMSDVANNQYSLIMFPTPVNLPASKKFFVSVDMSGLQWTSTIKDSISIVSNTHPQTTPSLTWEKWSTNAWYNLGSASSWSLNISLLIHPFLTQAPITTSITASQNTICTGQTINYSSTGSTAGTYEWDFGAIPTPTAAGPSASPVYPTAGTYTTFLILEDACGSLGIAQKTIQVNQTPVVTASPSSTSICQGASVILTGGGANTYAWTGGISNNTAFNPSSSGSYTVTGTAANQCTAAAVASITVNSNPIVTASASSTLVCDGSTLSLSGGGANNYSWTGGITDGAAFVPLTSGSYTVTGTSTANCTGTATIAITVAPNPTVTASASSASVCAGNTVTLNGSGAALYNWTGGITDGIAFTPATSGSYTVTGTNASNCSGTATIALVVAPVPTVTAIISNPTICVGSSVTLSGSGASTYSWTGGVTNAVAFSPASTNTYVVTGTDANGCSGTANAVVVVDPCTGLNQLNNQTSMNVYPNPFTEMFTVNIENVSKGLSVELYNTLGQLVLQQDVTGKTTVLSQSLPEGLYILKLIENEKILSTEKIIKK